MTREPESQQWREWDDGPELSRSWPSPHADIDVDTAGLRKVGNAITMEVDGARGYESSALKPWRDMAVEVGHLGMVTELESLAWLDWTAFRTLGWTLGLIGGRVTDGTQSALESYDSFGNMIFATSANYAMADSVFDKNISVLRYAVNGAGVRHQTSPTKDGWPEDDVSGYDAPKIKSMLASIEVASMLRKGGACAELATWLTNLQSLIEEHAKQLAGAWRGEPAELALDAFRKVHATTRALAHSVGTTGETIIWLANVIHRYQVNFESVVKLGDWEFDDDLPDWLLPSGGGAHDRARDYLRDLNQYMKAAYDMLPAEIETLLPTARSDDAKSAYKGDGLKDGSDYWDSMITYKQPLGSGEPVY